MKKDRTTTVNTGQVVVDLFQPADAEGVSACYRNVYGDHFPMSYVYDPEEIAARNVGTDQYTVVARTESGEIVGLIGMFRSGENEGFFEIGQLMVRREYRGGSIAGELYDFILATVPQQAGIRILYGEALCSHTVSQKMSLDRGLVPCGLELETMPVSVAADRDKAPSMRRDSLLQIFLQYRDRPQSVFLPRKQASFCEHLYDRLGAERTIIRTGASPGRRTTSTHERIQAAGLLRINITAIGKDLVAHVREKTTSGNETAQNVHVLLKLDDPAVEYACTILEEQGFFVGGLLPQWFGVDGLLLQKLVQPPDFSRIRLLPGQAEEVGDWVRNNMLISGAA